MSFSPLDSPLKKKKREREMIKLNRRRAWEGRSKPYL